MKHRKTWFVPAILMLIFFFSMVIQMQTPAWAKDEAIPFQRDVLITATSSPLQAHLDIPDGFRLTIDNFTATIQLTDGILVDSFIINTTVNGESARHAFPVRLMADNSSPQYDWFVAGETRLLFADAQEGSNSDVSVSINFSDTLGFAQLIFTVTGYLSPLD